MESGINKNEKGWRDEESLWINAMNHATWNGGRFQDEWWRAATWSAQTLKIRPKKESTQVLLNTLAEFLFYFKIQCLIYKRGDTLFINIGEEERKVRQSQDEFEVCVYAKIWILMSFCIQATLRFEIFCFSSFLLFHLPCCTKMINRTKEKNEEHYD